MKKLLLIASFVVLGSSLVASEKSNELSKNIVQVGIYQLIKEHPLKTAATTFGAGFILAVPFISFRVKTIFTIGAFAGAGIMLKVLDEGTYNDVEGQVKNFYINTVVPEYTSLRDKIKVFYNENMTKKD